MKLNSPVHNHQENAMIATLPTNLIQRRVPRSELRKMMKVFAAETRDGCQWHPGLKCYLRSIYYDAEKHTGVALFPKRNCCDMTACIKLFKRIDKECLHIVTFAGKYIDTSYHLDSDGKWESILNYRLFGDVDLLD
jgi:hypothetical protein